MKTDRTSDAPTCGSCESYRGRDMDQAAVARAEAAGVAVPAGHCWLLPTPVTRHVEDRCFHHSGLVRQRQRELADLLADALAARGVQLPIGE